MNEVVVRLERARVALDGLSVGDALGAQFFQAQYRQRMAARQVPEGVWRYTDDTEMALAVFEVLEQHESIVPEVLAKAFARRYAKDTSKGYGKTAHRILANIGEGMPWDLASGSVFGGQGSLGNGGAMRVAPLGAYFAEQPELLVEQARLSAIVTHAHPEGQAGAIAAAVATGWAWKNRHRIGPDSGTAMLEAVLQATPEGETHQGLLRACKIPWDTPVQLVVGELGNGSREISPDTLPFALWCAAGHLNSFTEAFWTTISGFGDIDTNAAIVGGIVAMVVGREGIPTEWLAAREELNADEPDSGSGIKIHSK